MKYPVIKVEGSEYLVIWYDNEEGGYLCIDEEGDAKVIDVYEDDKGNIKYKLLALAMIFPNLKDFVKVVRDNSIKEFLKC